MWVECVRSDVVGPVVITHDRYGGVMVWRLGKEAEFGDLELMMTIHENIAAQKMGVN